MYIQEESTDIWKENILEDLKLKELKFKLAGKVLAELKKEFGREYDELAKVAELKKAEQGPQTMDKFVQMFRHAVKNNRYKS